MTREELLKKRRAEFESWAISDGFWVGVEHGKAFYENSATQCAWRAWSAALDSLEIELPDISDSADIAWHHADIRDAIEQQGYKVKP